MNPIDTLKGALGLDEEEKEEVESSNPTADTVLNRMGSLNPFSGGHSPSRSPNGSQSLTGGRRKTLRESGWDGVQGTHHEVKYRKLDQLQQRQKEAERQASAHSGNRAQKFESLSDDLSRRIRQQQEEIAMAEA